MYVRVSNITEFLIREFLSQSIIGIDKFFTPICSWHYLKITSQCMENDHNAIMQRIK